MSVDSELKELRRRVMFLETEFFSREPSKPAYVPLVSDAEMLVIVEGESDWESDWRLYGALMLRKAAGRLQREAPIADDAVVPSFGMCAAIRALCDWADQEEKLPGGGS